MVNYESTIGGPKTRAALGTAQSANWGELLAPFGVVRKQDPNDWRVLLPVTNNIEQPVYQKREAKTSTAP